MNPVEDYFKQINTIKSTGGAVDETSYYIPLCNLLNEIGKKLKPKVFCHSQVKNTGAGNPDFGLYAKQQLQDLKAGKPLAQLPERGVIEVKPTSDDSWVTAEGEQVTKYWGHYGQVLVTNYWDFVFIGQDANGNPAKLETFRLADSETDFWAMTNQHHKFANEKGERLVEYLRRVMLHSAILSEPEKIAWFLASYAKEAKARIESAGDLPSLAAIRQGLEECLGMKFEGDDGEHFFRATLIQTLFYGVFSSWVLWSRNNRYKSKKQFSWHETVWNLHVPMIAALFSQIATPNKLKPLGIDEVLDWAEMVLNRVDRTRFFRKFEEEHAVQYFYEPFLKAYDPELRKDLGVWYTPPEIVKYQVARIDTALREELDIEDGLADTNVYVLDPCCGTGAYLVEVLRKIHETLEEKGADALMAQQLKKAAMKRVFGFEILPAPFVVAHLQLGLMLKNLNAPLSDKKNERVGVYLTNALTGWEPEKNPKNLLPFPELQAEHDAAEKIKCDTPILVILGNPPYNAFAGTSPEEEEGLVEEYKGIYYEEKISKRGPPPKRIRHYRLSDPESKGGWGIKKFNLDDLYIRFFRIAERRIVKGGKGIVSYISNHSWVSEPSFVILREQLLKSFDKFWIENLHGNRKISEYAPDGRTSETIFAIPKFSSGIQQGVVTSLWVKTGKQKTNPAKIFFRDDIDAAKAVERRKQLLESLDAKNLKRQYKTSKPEKRNRYSFRPSEIAECYLEWPTVVDLCLESPFNGLMEKRGGVLHSIDRENLEERMHLYYDSSVEWECLKNNCSGLTKDAARFNARDCRDKVLAIENYDPSRLCQYAMRPFDMQWCYYSPVRPLWNEPRPSYWEQCWDGNTFFMTRIRTGKSPEGTVCHFVTGLSDDHFIAPDNACFPIRLRQKPKSKSKDCGNTKMFDDEPEEKITANLSEPCRAYLQHLGIKNPDQSHEKAALIWMHSLAIGYSPAYLSENADGIRQDWPRIPLPDSKDMLLNSAALGRQIAALLDTESNVKTVTSGTVQPELRSIGVVTGVAGDSINPSDGDLDITASWGHFGKNNAVMPGKGKVIERSYTPKERALIKERAVGYGLTLKQALEQLGETTCDIYLNDAAYWSNIPANVWNYYIGGYQVIKKWLSYREKQILGRGLKIEEAHEVMNMARRIAAIILLQPALDKNYKDVKKSIFNWLDNQI